MGADHLGDLVTHEQSRQQIADPNHLLATAIQSIVRHILGLDVDGVTGAASVIEREVADQPPALTITAGQEYDQDLLRAIGSMYRRLGRPDLAEWIDGVINDFGAWANVHRPDPAGTEQVSEADDLRRRLKATSDACNEANNRIAEMLPVVRAAQAWRERIMSYVARGNVQPEVWADHEDLVLIAAVDDLSAPPPTLAEVREQRGDVWAGLAQRIAAGEA